MRPLEAGMSVRLREAWFSFNVNVEPVIWSVVLMLTDRGKPSMEVICGGVVVDVRFEVV